MGGLKDAFFGPKIMKNGHVLAHPIHPGNGPRFLAKNCPKIMDGTLRENPGPMASHGLIFIIIYAFFFISVFV